MSCALRPEPAEALPETARVACFVTAQAGAETALREGLARRGVEPRVFSTNLARRDDLERDVEAALRDGCDVFLTELKAAAIDVVAEAAARRGRPGRVPAQPPGRRRRGGAIAGPGAARLVAEARP